MASRRGDESVSTFPCTTSERKSSNALSEIFDVTESLLTLAAVDRYRPTDFSMGRGISSIKRLIVLERVKKDGK
jgi:hypothetical protein